MRKNSNVKCMECSKNSFRGCTEFPKCWSGKACMRRRNYYRKHDYKKKQQRAYLYGITVEHYERIIKEQNNLCDICKQEFTETPNIDHNHITGEVRGLLCSKCNMALGAINENIRYAKRLIKYIQKHTKPSKEEMEKVVSYFLPRLWLFRGMKERRNGGKYGH